MRSTMWCLSVLQSNYMIETCITGDARPYLLARRLPRVANIADTATLCQHKCASEIVALDITTKVAVLAKACCYESEDTLLVLYHEIVLVL